MLHCVVQLHLGDPTLHVPAAVVVDGPLQLVVFVAGVGVECAGLVIPSFLYVQDYRMLATMQG